MQFCGVVALAALSLPFAEAFSPNCQSSALLSRRSGASHATASAHISSTKLSVAADLTHVDFTKLDLGTDVENIVTPKGSQNSWEVHKFGGASLATAELYKTVGDLLIAEASGTRKENNEGKGAVPTMAIVSARGGMTDLLVKVVDSALVDLEAAKTVLLEAIEGQIDILKELAPPSITDQIEANIRNDANDILLLVQSLRMINTVPSVTMEVVTGYGEIWSAQTLNAYLQTKQGIPAEWIDARPILRVKSDSSGLGEKGEASTGGVVPLWEQTTSQLSEWWNTIGKDKGMQDCDYQAGISPIVVVTGFVASTIDGVPTTLKRSGSDYSATIFAKLTGASRVTMWKNTDGVYTADPRRVPEAFSISSLKYDEALELAYFGAQVLHPSAMVPCIDDSIPVYVRNIFNPSFKGTVVQGRSPTLAEKAKEGSAKNWRAKKGEIPIKGITSVDSVALVTLEGASTIGGSNVAEKFMGAMADNDINVLIITQASSESSICIAVPENEGQKAINALQSAFELELARSTVGSISLDKGVSIVAIVGEGMAYSSGISSTLMGSLSKANVNIRLIAQGSSERQIAVVVDKDDTTRALRAAHQAFTLSDTTASITLLGTTGTIGSAFVKALEKQRRTLIDGLGVCPRIMISANSKKMSFAKNANGLPIDSIISKLSEDDDEDTMELDLEKITAEIEADVNPHRVIIDMTNSQEVADYYARWMSLGVDLISPSRRVAAGPLEKYHKAIEVQKENFVNWQYESSVGSALPILTTVRDLIETGDSVNKIRGSVSGTFAYVLSLLDEETSFSDAFAHAAEKGFTEKDIREDLMGIDVARKIVILARQIGMDVDIEDVEIESFLIGEMAEKEDLTVEDLKAIDADMLKKYEAAKAEGRKLRYKFEIEKESGKCRCFLDAVDNKDPLYRLKSIENLVAFETDLYTASPLIVKGAAAGADLAAAGVFSDLLRCTRAYTSERS
mmetsp:Transcript_13069/g.36783  ORF Transcript_13069/g.36783 Transcript_13069/m.36783 type:complete len:965 (-) Transcript_13069:479-3373(-)|eukprot:CAMPEP_0172374442 /NCGR_PEP_ID=MMETSP1060-20121228/55872_1 /TAXON_ID=37318 /ORGANISM="Pseudo-nitzschia pungens, Strain cf. cingulata" /LENGTH=964 /DNA_ID=CAMNT_0013101131 /DNA_START=120 /DNA_END=3014 /DNA_ORIENTATION=-